MKQFSPILFLALFFSLPGFVAAQSNVYFNIQNEQVISNVFHFDIYMWASQNGTYHSRGQIYFDYNAATFGTSIQANGQVSVTPEELVNETFFGINKYQTLPAVDNGPTRVAITWLGQFPGAAPGPTFHTEVTTVPKKLYHVALVMLNTMQTPVVSLSRSLMAGQQFFLTAANSEIPYGDGAYIGNLVWSDNNANGIYDPGAGETGLAGVTVRLYRDDNNDGIPNAGPAFATTVTDASGLYLFFGSPINSGNYIVGVETPTGYNSSPINGGDPDLDPTDNDDNGVTTVGAETRSHTFSILIGSEPLGESPNNAPTAPPSLLDWDAYGNLTVDFGFAPSVLPAPVALNLSARRTAYASAELEGFIGQHNGPGELIIERSGQGLVFEPVVRLQFDAAQERINWTDRSISSEKVFYRMLYLDASGLISYSNTVELGFGDRMKATCYPSPTNGPLTLKFSAPLSMPASYRLLNATGQLLSSNTLTRGLQSAPLDLGTQPSGLYFLQIQYADGFVETLQIARN